MHPYIEDRSIPEPNSGCLLWTLAYYPNGYGHASYRGLETCAHRVSWQLHCGPIADGLHVCHKCDNRACVNPDHLFLGTPQDNAADKVAKGRHPRGVMKCNAKLSEDTVRAIRSSELGGRDLARFYGVTESAIRQIKKRKTWAHVEDGVAA